MWMSSSGSRFLRIYLSSISKEYIYLASPKDILSSDTFNYLATVEFRAIAACRYWHLASYCIIFSLADLWFIYPTFSHQATSPAREVEGEGGEGDRSRSIHGKESTATGSDARADANYNCHSIWMPRSTAPHEENDVGFIQSFYQDHDYFFFKKKKNCLCNFLPFLMPFCIIFVRSCNLWWRASLTQLSHLNFGLFFFLVMHCSPLQAGLAWSVKAMTLAAAGRHE